jgi:hypothetical protein
MIEVQPAEVRSDGSQDYVMHRRSRHDFLFGQNFEGTATRDSFIRLHPHSLYLLLPPPGIVSQYICLDATATDTEMGKPMSRP